MAFILRLSLCLISWRWSRVKYWACLELILTFFTGASSSRAYALCEELRVHNKSLDKKIYRPATLHWYEYMNTLINGKLHIAIMGIFWSFFFFFLFLLLVFWSFDELSKHVALNIHHVQSDMYKVYNKVVFFVHYETFSHAFLNSFFE